jgi:CubicO group peptidase (beta-lactamase class C family)
MALLSERGVLSLQDPVARWWPPAPSSWESMTISHLLSHAAGLGHWRDLPRLDMSHPHPPDEILDRAVKLPLRHRPGTAFEYSGVGYLLAAAIIEAASRRPYGEFVANNVFQPLGMTSTTSGVARKGEGVAGGHSGGEQTPLVVELTALPGTGDLWTTVSDLVRYAEAVSSGALLSDSSWRAMSEPLVPLTEDHKNQDPIDAFAYGYGTYVGTVAGQRAWFHLGDNPGFRSFLGWLPDADVVIALLCNEESVVLDDVVPTILRAINR